MMVNEREEKIPVFRCGHVAANSHPILVVLHDHDGTWHLLCGAAHDAKPSGKAPLVSTNELVKSDPTLLPLLTDLPLGFAAERRAVGAKWQPHKMGPAVRPEIPAYVCPHVFQGARPVLLAAHFEDAWQLLCGAAHGQGEGPHLVGLNHLVDRDSTLTEILDLPVDFEAEREAAGRPWQRRGPIKRD